MRTNKRKITKTVKTSGGARAYKITPKLQLQRSVMSFLLWENGFYENGESIVQRIQSLVPQVMPQDVAEIAVRARHDMKLRHVPLFLIREMVRYPDYRPYVRDALNKVIQRPDEMAEFMAMYYADGRQPIANSVKRGLADAFHHFDAYSFAKWRGAGREISLRDVMFMVHPKPVNEKERVLFAQIANDTLPTPDTWEVALSSNSRMSKREKWERLLREERLGALALLRNLRNMQEEGVDDSLIIQALQKMNGRWVLPFRYFTAAKINPRFEKYIEEAMIRNMAQLPKLQGKTLIVVDVSGSMYYQSVSAKSSMDRAQAAATLAAVARELCEEPVIYATAGNDITGIHQTELVPSRRGIALVDAIYNLCSPLGGGGIFVTPVLDYLKEVEKYADRIILITDEEDTSFAAENQPTLAKPFGAYNYMLNVANGANGVGYGAKWTHIDGWSENVLKYILEIEKI